MPCHKLAECCTTVLSVQLSMICLTFCLYMSGVFCTNNAQAPSLFSNVLRWKRGRELVHCLYKKLQTCLPTSRRPAKPYFCLYSYSNCLTFCVSRFSLFLSCFHARLTRVRFVELFCHLLFVFVQNHFCALV